ncbi:GSCOCG00000846001-RA-CDS [Cotesia congregata]|uniref:Uncharacterized protein n=1 Tax=Cotesia congregata TaxID=51543 RepID=A0A8J2HH75_COTCN|nr:GSCOCG00000846001-RA-CDS [Cotesia congregata]CAG5095617.1 Protein of unknown function [Cotesia congregata]
MRWKYAYWFLIVTFLVMIFVSLISISVTMYLNELRNQTVAICSVDSALNTSASDTDENYNCSISDSDQSIDNNTQKPVGDGLSDNNDKIILRADIHSADSASTPINKTGRIDNHITSETSQSTNKTKKDLVTDRKDDIVDQNKKDLTEQSTPTPDKSIQWLDINNSDWILPIFYRNKSDTPSIWKYGCMGILIHPKAVLTVRFAINKSKEVAHAVGIFDRTKGRNEIDVNYDQLYDPLKFTSASPYKLLEFSYTFNNKTRNETKYELGLFMMIMKEAINSIKPVDVSQTSLMPLQDMFDEKIIKECVHVTFVENFDTRHFEEKKISEKLMNRSAMVESYTATYKDKCVKLCELMSVNYIPESNVFGTVDSLKFDDKSKKFKLLGSPLACRLVSDGPDSYSFAGILINSFYTGMYEYTNVHHELKWIQQKLKKIVV